jgi:hypothetical protein
VVPRNQSRLIYERSLQSHPGLVTELRVTTHAVEWPWRVPVVPQPEKSLAALRGLAGPLAAPLTPLDRAETRTVTSRTFLTLAPEALNDILLYTDSDHEDSSRGPGSGLLLGGAAPGPSLCPTPIFYNIVLYLSTYCGSIL